MVVRIEVYDDEDNVNVPTTVRGVEGATSRPSKIDH